jgi:phosphohistidine phosphatase
VHLYLVHHGEAESSDVDPQRPLTARGHEAVVQLATTAAARGVRPKAIWHSGKLRARQTADAFWRACNPLSTRVAVRGLRPDDPPTMLRTALVGEDDDLMVVGHMPNLSRVLACLTTGDVDGVADFPQHGIVGLERVEGGGWIERWRASG